MKAEIDHIAVTMLLDIDNVQLESGLIYTHIPQVAMGDRQHLWLHD